MGWGKDRPQMGQPDKKWSLPSTKIKNERKTRAQRDASVAAQKAAKGKNW